MTRFYDTLKIEYGKYHPECVVCEEACIKAKNGDSGGVARIKAINALQVQFHGAMTCNQCSQPACVEICPTYCLGVLKPEFPQHLDRVHPDEKAESFSKKLYPLPKDKIQLSPEEIWRVKE